MMKELEHFIDSENAWANITASRTIDMPLSIEDCQTLFASLAMKLSPENLHCDGEISNKEAKKKAVYLNKVWSQLETIYGCSVDESEAFNWS